MFSFHVDFDTIFERFIAQRGARPGLVTQLRFEAPGDLTVDIIKMQKLTLV